MTSIDTRSRLPVEINGRYFEIHVPAYRRAAIDATRQLNDQGGEVGEQTLNSQYIWKRTAEDWRLGMGQPYFDLVEETSRRRYHDSIGIDPWTARELTLLPEATSRYAEPNGDVGEAWLLSVGGQLVYARTVVDSLFATVEYCIDFVDDPDTTTWTLTSIVTGADSIESICADGQAIYYKLAGANQIKRLTVTAASTASSTNIGDNTKAVTNLYIVAGRLIGQDLSTDTLYEVKASTVTTIATYETRQMPILTGVCNGPSGIYMSAIARRSFATPDWSGVAAGIYRSTLDETTGAINVPSPIVSLPEGEAITSLLGYAGYMILGTSTGIRLGQWTATGGVEYGPVIEVTAPVNYTSNTTDSLTAEGVYSGGVQCLDGDGRYVWFGWGDKTFTDEEGLTTTYSGIGRLDLGRFVDALQPAYATDLMIEGVDYPTIAVASYGGKRYFVRQIDGPYGQADTKVADGWISSGPITFGTPEAKRFTNLEVRTAKLPNAAVITLNVLDEFGDLVYVDTFTGDDAYEFTTPLMDVVGEQATVILRLSRGYVETEAPKLRRWTLRAIAVPQRQEEIWLPIYLHDEVTHTGTSTVPFDIHDDFIWLRALWEARSIFTLVMGDEAINVFIDAIMTGGDADVTLVHWNTNERWPEGLWFVKLITI